MRPESYAGTVTLILVGALATLTGCTRNIQPTDRYDEFCSIVAIEKPVSNPVKGVEKTDATAAQGYDAFRDLMVARTYLRNKRERYAQHACERELANDGQYDRPLIVTAIAAGAAALAKANPYVVGGIGLTAGSIAAFKAHDHPDGDRDAYLAAYEKLTCAYDATHSLRDNLRFQTLQADRLALRTAIDAVNAADGASKSAKESPTSAAKAVADAAGAAKDAGEAALAAVNKEIQSYGGIADAVYALGSSAEITARKAARRNGSYSDAAEAIKNTYASVSQTQLQKADAEAKVNKAATAAAVAKSLAEISPGKSKAPDQPLMSSGAIPFANENLTILREREPQSASGDSETSLESPDWPKIDRKDLPVASALADTSTSKILKLVRVAEIAMNDLPSPTYTLIIAKISTCKEL